jgi:hypothetical protein
MVLDEAHYYASAPDSGRMLDAELAGYTQVCYRVTAIDPRVRSASDMVVIVTRDCPLATHIRAIENHIATDSPRAVIDDIAQAVRAQYDITPPAAT